LLFSLVKLSPEEDNPICNNLSRLCIQIINKSSLSQQLCSWSSCTAGSMGTLKFTLVNKVHVLWREPSLSVIKVQHEQKLSNCPTRSISKKATITEEKGLVTLRGY
jgi:hypothetical protein